MMMQIEVKPRTMHNMLYEKDDSFDQRKKLIQITGEIIHMDFAFYNVTPIRGLSFIITAVCSNTIMLWVFTDATKQSTLCIIRFILTTFKTEQHT